jgi:hypothetical protein
VQIFDFLSYFASFGEMLKLILLHIISDIAKLLLFFAHFGVNNVAILPRFFQLRQQRSFFPPPLPTFLTPHLTLAHIFAIVWRFFLILSICLLVSI